MPFPLFLYFTAEILYLLPVWGTFLIVGRGPLYGWVYSLCSAMVLAAMGYVAWSALQTRTRRWESGAIAAVIAVSFTHFAFVGLPTVHWWDWVCLLEATGFLWGGLILAYTAPHNRLTAVNFVLGLYWMAVALMDYGFTLNWPNWLAVDWWLPQSVELLAFGIIFALLRVRGNAQRNVHLTPHSR